MAAARRPGFAETLKAGWKPAAARAGKPGSSRAAGRTRSGAKGRGKAVPRANGAGNAAGPPELVKRREELSYRLAELQWDLGGMAYEMASRDHYRLDVLNKQAAKLQEVDAELGQLELMLKLDDAGASGACPACGALHARGAVFCWQCGNELKPPTEPSEPAEAARGTKASKPG